jgi:hypothetical protein
MTKGYNFRKCGQESQVKKEKAPTKPALLFDVPGFPGYKLSEEGNLFHYDRVIEINKDRYFFMTYRGEAYVVYQMDLMCYTLLSDAWFPREMKKSPFKRLKL